MKKIVLLLFVTVFFSRCSQAQHQKFDLIRFTAPAGWQKSSTEQTMQWVKEDKTTGAFCIILMMKSIPASNNSKENFDAAWTSVVKEMVTVTASPEMQPVAKEDGWEAQSGYAPFESEGQKGVALLVASTGFSKMVNMLILTNTEVYQSEMEKFLESVTLEKPAATGENNNPASNNNSHKPARQDGYAFSNTNFDDGWTSTIHDDYVLVKKGNMNVYLSYIEKFNESEYSGTGKQIRHHYWDTYAGKYFVTGEKKFDHGGALSDFSPDFIEGWATDRQTGEKRYIGMIINIIAYTGTLSVIIASAPDEQQFRQHFPKADTKFNNDLLTMYNYNKFAVGKNDLVGKWSSSGGGTMGWYSTTTGQNVGATGVAKGDEFQFNPNNTYTSKHNGATGWVGSMNTYQQGYKGNYTLSNWTVTITNRWDGKTEKYEAWFEAWKGGRVLHFNSQSINYTLFKER